jgi:hypothetical protein
LFELERNSSLAFPITFKGEILKTVGEATDLFSKLSREQIERPYWHRAVIMMHVAVKCRQYLKTATINLQTAVAMDFDLLAQEASRNLRLTQPVQNE